MTTTIYDDTRLLIEEVIGDVLCVKQQNGNEWWTLWPGSVPSGAVSIRVLAGWNGEVIAVPIHPGRSVVWANAVTIGRAVPRAVAQNALRMVIEEFLSAIRHGDLDD